MTARQIHVIGRVQGVAFRAHTKMAADELNIRGFVRNESDGSVYIEAEGAPETMDLFLAWCHKGPRMARVDQVRIIEIPTKDFKDFAIQR